MSDWRNAVDRPVNNMESISADKQLDNLVEINEKE